MMVKSWIEKKLFQVDQCHSLSSHVETHKGQLILKYFRSIVIQIMKWKPRLAVITQ